MSPSRLSLQTIGGMEEMENYKVLHDLLKLARDAPEILILFSNEGECIYHNSQTYCGSYEEGGNRIHDCAEKLTFDEAYELVKSWAEKGMLRVAINGLTPPYEEGVEWFT